MILYSDIDPKCCAWITELIRAGEIPHGDVWCKPIQEIQPNDLRPYHQFHAFCGIAGWPYAGKLAGLGPDDEWWSGSAPCQPFSSAGKQEGAADLRHLWPAFFRLIKICCPVRIYSEQVERSIKHGWLDGIQADLEKEDYAVGSCVLGAHSLGAPHIRNRIYWVANSERKRPQIGQEPETGSRDLREWRQSGETIGEIVPEAFWSGSISQRGGDGRIRRIKPGIRVLAHGISGRVGLLRGYGNAIVPQVAAAFIQAAEAARADLNRLPHLHVRVEEPVRTCRIFNFDE